MDFSLTDDQVMIRDAAQHFLADKSDSEAVRRAMATEAGFEPGVWAAIGAELGWCAVAVPEEFGGMGMGPVVVTACKPCVKAAAWPTSQLLKGWANGNLR